MKIIDNFLTQFHDFQGYAQTLDYNGVTNPQDGVVYPDISIDIPDVVKLDVLTKLQMLYPFQDIMINQMFLRLSVKGVHVPNYAHTDSIMGSHSLMLYINPGEGGTAMLKHNCGMTQDPTIQSEIETWTKDSNNPDKWEIIEMCSIQENRACLFESKQFHSAEPFGGFGSSSKDGRLVLTAFFTVTSWQ